MKIHWEMKIGFAAFSIIASGLILCWFLEQYQSLSCPFCVCTSWANLKFVKSDEECVCVCLCSVHFIPMALSTCTIIYINTVKWIEPKESMGTKTMAVQFDHYLASCHWTIENMSVIFGSQVNIWRICLLFFSAEIESIIADGTYRIRSITMALSTVS